MSKRLFEIFDEINQMDIKNNTRLLSVSSNFVSADKIKQGAKICMGSDEQGLYDILNDKVIPILILVDKETYLKLKN